MKGLDVAVEASIASGVDGTFNSELYVGTLENGGTKLAPFNQFDGDVHAELKAELETAAAGIIDGSITVTP